MLTICSKWNHRLHLARIHHILIVLHRLVRDLDHFMALPSCPEGSK